MTPQTDVTATTDPTIVIVGFVPPALGSLEPFQPAGTVVVVDEPDVVRKRGVRDKVAGSPMLRELLEWEYQLPGAADRLVNARPDLSPAVVVPLTEYATPFAARLSERYGLPGAGLGAAQILRDKEQLRAVTAAAGVANPVSTPVHGPPDVRALMERLACPVVLKPANRQAAVGTRIVRSTAEVEQAWQDCLDQDEGIMVPDRQVPLRMLAEEYVEGAEYSVELLVSRGRPVFANVTGKLLYPGPRPVELGHVVPADLPDDQADLLVRRTEAVLRAVGFGSGIVHCEWIVRDGRPYLVECAGRFPGDGIGVLIDHAYGIDLVEAFYTVMRGAELPALPAAAKAAAAVRFLQVPPGRVGAVRGVPEVGALPEVVSCAVTVAPGDRVRPLRSSWDRVGSLTVVAPTAAEAARRAADLSRQVSVDVTADDSADVAAGDAVGVAPEGA